jgi:hypothetical protein
MGIRGKNCQIYMYHDMSEKDVLKSLGIERAV